MSGLTEAQRALRRTGIGGSEIAAVLGHGTRKTEDGATRTAFDVWVAKLHPLEQIDSVDAQRGIYLEPGIGDWYCARAGLTRGLAVGTVRHAKRPIALCTPDLLALHASGLARLVSIKAPRHSWEWGPDGTSEVPVDYALQLQWEHAVCSSFMPAGALDETLDLAALIGGELRIYHLRADADLQALMLDDAEAWWRTHVETQTPPPLDASAGARVWLRKKFPRDSAPVRQAEPREEVLLDRLHEADETHRQAEGAYDVVRREVEQAIGDAAGISGVAGVVTWKADAKGTRRFIKNWTKHERKKA